MCVVVVTFISCAVFDSCSFTIVLVLLPPILQFVHHFMLLVTCCFDVLDNVLHLLQILFILDLHPHSGAVSMLVSAVGSMLP